MKSKQNQRKQIWQQFVEDLVRIGAFTKEQIRGLSLKAALRERDLLGASDLTKVHPNNIKPLERIYNLLNDRVSQGNKPPIECEADAESEELVELSDSDYIHWMDEKEWSLTQAVYLLHGRVPPEREIAIDQLIKEFPRAKGLLLYYPKSNKNEESNQECPEDWVFLAAMSYSTDEPPGKEEIYDMDVPICWEAIFPQWIKGNGGYDFGESPDYRRFVQEFVSDTPTFLGELAEYVLDLGEKAMTNPPAEFYDILKYMNKELGLKAKGMGEMPERVVSPRKFIEKCPREYFSPASLCIRWVDWPTEHPKLAAKLKALGSPKKSAKSKKVTGDLLKEAFQFIVASYVSDIHKGIEHERLCSISKKIFELKDHYLKSAGETIGEKWKPESLRTQISRSGYGNPKNHEDVLNARKSVTNTFNQ